MVHWSEENDGYRLHVTRRWASFFWAVASLLPLFVWSSVLANGGPRLDMIPQLKLVMWVVVLTVVAGCLFRAAQAWRAVAWVEVSTGGRRVRWGGRGAPPAEGPVRADRFEARELLGTLGWNVVAVLEDDRRVPVLGAWVAPAPRVRRIVERLNQLLSSEAPR